MIQRWFVSYPRLCSAIILMSLCSIVTISLILHDPHGASLMVYDTAHEQVVLWVYAVNSIAQIYLQLLGWSGLFLLPVMAFCALVLIDVVSISWTRITTAMCMVYINALWCCHIAYEPFVHVMPGGWFGSLGYAWLVHGLESNVQDISYILRGALAVTGVATFRVRWIMYVKPVIVSAATYAYSGACALLQRLPYGHLPHIFTPVVHEHIARESDADSCDETIFDDRFWDAMRCQREQAYHHGDVKNISSYGEQESAYAGATSAEPEYTQTASTYYQKTSTSSKHVTTPSTQLLHYGATRTSEPDDIAHQQARRLEEKLATFGITGSVTHITCGPVVTLFSYQPDKAVKVANITAREDDLRLALEAVSMRIIAPIPGTSVVGFEVSRPEPQAVTLRQLLDEQTFWNEQTTLPLALGTDTAGTSFIADLAQMPHLLVAGSTGSGKSVALHSFLVSLLYRCHPDSTKMVLIDPKRLEFVAYQDVPHLAAPVITQSRSVVKTFEWLVREMEQRYDYMAQAGVRNISEYHAAYGKDALPYIVVVVDELADLMMGVGKDIEQYIARLAQMARAAGIHLIVATQRPSVDVVTGMIKVNFLSRIAFKVTSKIDSRTIVDQPGAEKLLGRGDMLYLDARGVLHRLHGGYVKQHEIDAVIRHWSQQPYEHTYIFDPAQQEQAGAADEEDDLYADVLEYVQSCDTVSISLIQRRFRIGYNRSARLVDMLERNGVVAAADSNKMRRVLQ